MADETIPDTAEVFDHFAALTSAAPAPGGALVFYGTLDRRGMATAVAANIAGAASLGVDAHADRAKLAVRQGICDFMVNSLDEALRILKNEIRKKQPVAVALVGDPERVVAEMLERGVQPDLIACDGLQSQVFLERGARALSAAVVTPDSLVVRWSVSQDAAAWLPRVDDLAIEALGNDADARVKWLRLAPRYLQKSLSREHYARMRAEELARFVGLLQARMQSGEISVPVHVSSDGKSVV
jgi:urocanate hydratase